MAAPPPDIGALINAFGHIFALKYYFVACAVVLFWDIGITFGTEVEHIWKKKWGSFTCLWFLLRYAPPLMEIVVLDALFDPSWSFETFVCKTWLPFAGTYSLVCVALVQCVFAIRIYVLFEVKKIILVIFGIFLVAEVAFMAFFINHTTAEPDPPGIVGCAGGGAFGSRGAAAFWAPSILFDVVVFAMTVYKSYITIKRNRSFGILGVLLRDGSLYFTLVLFVNMINIMTLILAPLDLASVNANLATAVPVVITTRLILNLKASRASESSGGIDGSRPSNHRIAGGNSHSSQWNLNQPKNNTAWSFGAVLDVFGALDAGSERTLYSDANVKPAYRLEVLGSRDRLQNLPQQRM